VLRRIVQEQGNVVVLAARFNKLGFEVSTDLLKDGSKPLDGIHVKDPMAIPWRQRPSEREVETHNVCHVEFHLQFA
jgi:hypothetical protein